VLIDVRCEVLTVVLLRIQVYRNVSFCDCQPVILCHIPEDLNPNVMILLAIIL